MRLRKAAVAAMAGALWVLGAVPAGAAEWHTALWNGLMSPYCPGRTLIDCPSPQAGELREWIADQEAAGRSQDEVEEELYAQFGDVILQAPKAEGFGLAAYVIPVAAFAGGGALVWLFLRRQRRAAPAHAGGAPPAAIDPEIDRLIDEELSR